jgi:hypothetical protein
MPIIVPILMTFGGAWVAVVVTGAVVVFCVVHPAANVISRATSRMPTRAMSIMFLLCIFSPFKLLIYLQ